LIELDQTGNQHKLIERQAFDLMIVVKRVEAIDCSSISEMSPSFDSKVLLIDDSPLMQELSLTEVVVPSHHNDLN
jgi:hypothetical protein